MGPICRRMATLTDAAIKRERRLPLSGDIVVRQGDQVEPTTLIGYNSSEECLHILRLEVDEHRVLAKLLRQTGDAVKRGEPVAYYMYFFGLGYKEYVSPVNGTISSFDPHSGVLMIREHPIPVHAGMYGTVEEVIEGHSAILSARGSVVEGMAGWGELAFGELLVLADGPDENLDPQRIGPRCRGKIVVGGALADSRALMAAYRHGARAVVAGGISKLEGDEFAAFTADMSYEEYAARFYSAGQDMEADSRAGLDRVMMAVLATDGLGRVPMRPEAFDMLRANQGMVAYVDSGSGRTGDGVPEVSVTRPEPDSGALAGEESDTAPASRQALAGVWLGLAEGARARVVGGLRHGLTGSIAAWGADMTVETGRVVPGARLKLADGSEVDVPLANLELLGAGK
ncbi:MAG: hypothetical protein Q8P31_03210 [Bacillota bacterium]|nr:hypothetical protein [Bacillota bacterium]